MPRMTHPASGRQRIVPQHAMPRYAADGWRPAGQPAPSTSAPEQPEKPSAADTKAQWVAYARSQGVDDADEWTKADLMELLGG